MAIYILEDKYESEIATMKKYTLIMFIMYFTVPVSAQMDHVTFLRPPIRIPIEYYLGHIQVQDFDGDGKTDLVGVLIDDNRSPGSSYQRVRIWRNLSNHDEIRFNERVHRFSIGRDSRIVILADMSGDNRQDIVCINQPGRDSDGAIIVLVRD
ncbi:MAG TPA: hypothetical protein DIT99_21670 [Candidatus Latescibacteria bacterium]|nr:hypothetical protein [Candidatus Latescibacterota bacterium]